MRSRLGPLVCVLAGCLPQPAHVATDRLQDLIVEGAAMTPAFSPDVRDYHADVSLLNQKVRVRAVGETGTTVSLAGAVGQGATLTTSLPLALGENVVSVVVTGTRGSGSSYRVAITRRDEPWLAAEVIKDAAPRENGYFGDYLRASLDVMYVSSARRGQLYRRAASGWVFDRRVEDLFDVELAWMYEAALTADTLALVAQPSGGDEMLYLLSATGDGGWRRVAEFATGDQGTVRCAGDELAFVSAAGVRLFHRGPAGWAEVQAIPAPAADIGFGVRPTYFDAPGVAMTEAVLVVGAPFAGDGGNETGVAFVYERDASGLRRETARLAAAPAAPGMHFGQAAAIAGDRIAIGTRDQGAGDAVQSGAVYVYERAPGGPWQAAGMLKASQPRAYDYFGEAVVLAGDTLLVAASGHDGAAGAGPGDTSAPDAGGIFAFARVGDAWSERGVFKLPARIAPPHPFPAQMLVSDAALLVAANTAGHVTAGGDILNQAGEVFSLY